MIGHITSGIDNISQRCIFQSLGQNLTLSLLKLYTTTHLSPNQKLIQKMAYTFPIGNAIQRDYSIKHIHPFHHSLYYLCILIIFLPRKKYLHKLGTRGYIIKDWCHRFLVENEKLAHISFCRRSFYSILISSIKTVAFPHSLFDLVTNIFMWKRACKMKNKIRYSVVIDFLRKTIQKTNIRYVNHNWYD